MCLSIFLAQLIGSYAILMSLIMLVHQNRFKKTMTEFLSSHPLITLSGGLSLLFGLVIVLTHNIWISDWPVVITIVGWFLLLQAVMRLMFPDTFIKIMKDLMAKTGYLLLCWVWLIVGIYLVWASMQVPQA